LFLSLFISLMFLLNPFALFVYLNPIMEDLSPYDFFKVLFKATLISFIIFIIFSLFGKLIFSHVLHISIHAFRIFGGAVIFAMALTYIILGKQSLITLRGSLDDLASEIAMPFLVGAATISVCILIGEKFSPATSVILITLALATNYLMIVLLYYIKTKIPSKALRIAFNKVLVYSLRINGFFIGAIGVNMIIQGIKNTFK